MRRKIFTVLFMTLAFAGSGRASQDTCVTPGAPLTMANLKVFLDNCFSSFGTKFSGTTPPAAFAGSTVKTYQWWVDSSTTPAILKLYDGANWIAVGAIDAVNSQFIPSAPVGALTLASGLNSNIVNPLTRIARIAGPGGVFSVGGFTKPLAGAQISIFNSVAFAMTLVNEDASSTAANRIKTLTGANVTLRAGTSAASLYYDGSESRWILLNTN